jgi:hypothetical protein
MNSISFSLLQVLLIFSCDPVQSGFIFVEAQMTLGVSMPINPLAPTQWVIHSLT